MKILQNHPTFLHARDISQICQPLKAIEIDYFSHIMIDKTGKFSAIGTCPEFAELYFTKKYYNFDIHRSPIQQEQRYIIWDYMVRDLKLDEVYEDFKSFSLGHSFTISAQDKDGCKHFYDFSATLGNERINQSWMRNLDALKWFILYFNEQIHASSTLKNAYNIKFIMSEDEQAPTDQNIDPLSLKINRIYFSHNTYLTLREFQCLHWLSEGKTFDEISLVLAITTRTVKAHISNIKQKLACKSLFQLGYTYQAWKNINIKNPVLF